MLVNSNPDEAKKLLNAAQENVNERWKLYQHMATMSFESRKAYKDREEQSMIDLSTNYLGLKLKNPVVVSASPLTEKLENFARLEDAGAAAIVMYSLMEEQIEAESANIDNAAGVRHQQLRRVHVLLSRHAEVSRRP